MSQHQRDVAMGRFRNGSTNMLIATDVAARGIDVDNVEAVINYDLPQDNEYYVHRIGRTGRAGKTGRSFTFVSGREIYRIRQLEHFCRTTIEEKKLPGASKVLKAKADKYLNRAWELREHEDIELMKSFLQRKMTAEDCDALELAAVMLKFQIGDKGPEIEADDYESRRGSRDRRLGRRSDREEGRRRRGREEEREGRRRRGPEEEREGRRRHGSEEARENRGRRGSEEERENRRRRGPEEEREGRRRRGFEEERESRRKRERDENRSGKVRDVRMDGSEKGMPFPFSKRKKKK